MKYAMLFILYFWATFVVTYALEFTSGHPLNQATRFCCCALVALLASAIEHTKDEL